MNEKKYIIDTIPIPWRRAGLNGKTFYDTQANEKVNIALSLAHQHGKLPLFDGPLEIIATFFITIPETKKKILKEGDWQTEKSDFDNYAKFLADTISGILITDDKRISRAVIEKRYSSHPRTEFTIRILK